MLRQAPLPRPLSPPLAAPLVPGPLLHLLWLPSPILLFSFLSSVPFYYPYQSVCQTEKQVQRRGPRDNERWRRAQRLNQSSKTLTHTFRILEHSREQIENGSSRDCERVGVWDGASCLYVWGRALMCTMCKGMCMVSMHVHAQVSCSLYADISKHRVWSIVCLSVYFPCMCQYLWSFICILIMHLHHLYDYICLHEPLCLHFTNV